MRLHNGIGVQKCGRAHVLGLCILNLATFPPTEKPVWRELPFSWWSLQRRLHLNHVLVAQTEDGKVIGSVEVHSAPYQQLMANGAYTPEQLDLLQPYLASLAVRKDMRGRGIGRALVEAAVEEVMASSDTAEHILLGVEANNTEAVRLYESCDFKRLSANGCQIHVMRRSLMQKAEVSEDPDSGEGR
jgi:ribosomal protein S18 acetylase RimI-like enzyme